MSFFEHIKNCLQSHSFIGLVLLVYLPVLSVGQSPFEQIIRISQDSARTVLATTEDPAVRALATYQIGRKYMKTHIDSSVYYIEEAIKLATEIEDAEMINRMKKSLTFPYIDGQKLREAEELLYEIKPFFQTFRKGELYVSWCVNIGYLMTENGRFEEAIVYLVDALEIAMPNKKYSQINDILNRIGIVYGRIGISGKALEYYEKVIYNCEVLEKSHMYTASLMNAASILKDLGQEEKALQYFERAINIRKKSNSKRMRLSVLSARSRVAEIKGDLPKAISYIQQALEITQSLTRQHDVESLYLRMSELYQLVGNQKKADIYIVKAYELQSVVKNVRNTNKILSEYAKYKSRSGDYKSAFEIQIKLDSIDHTRRLGDAEDRIIKMEISEFQRLREIEMENLKSESGKIKLELDRKETERIYLIILSLLLLGTIGLIYRNSQNRKRTNEALKEKNNIISKSLNENNTLMKEIHHRVKNNLQIVSSMLSLQLRYIDDGKAKDVMIESRDRVKSMALIHQKLYQEDNLKGVFMPTYIESLLSSLAHSYKLDSMSIDIDNEVDEIWLDVDSAIPIGLIINELTTNSIKHAFADDGGKLSIQFLKDEDTLSLNVTDNGIGVGNSFDIEKQECFGFKMINSFLKKLKGQIEVRNDNGTQIKIIIKRFKEIDL